MQWLKLITIILGLTCVAYSIEIVAKERSPGCNPVPENDEVILKVATSIVWDKCHWYRSQKANQTLDDTENCLDCTTVCKQFPQQNPVGDLTCQNNDTLQSTAEGLLIKSVRSTHLSGGSAQDKQSCSLHISEIDAAMDNGFWNVAVVSSSTQPNATAQTRDYASFQIVTNQRNDLTLATNLSNPSSNAHVNSTVGQKVSFVCKSTNGSPKPRSFEWRIDDTFSFYGNWHAVLYPMQYDDPNEPNAVTQTLEVEAPSTGTFLVNCTSDQNGYYSTTANLTLSVTEGGGGNGTAVLSTTWIIVISVSCGLVLILIAICLIAFFCGMCCFKKPEPKRSTTDVPDPPPPRQMNNNDYQRNQNYDNNTQNIEMNPSLQQQQLQRKSESRPDVLATRSRGEDYRSPSVYDPQMPRNREFGYQYDNNGYLTSPRRYATTDRLANRYETSTERQLPPQSAGNRSNRSHRSNTTADASNTGALV